MDRKKRLKKRRERRPSYEEGELRDKSIEEKMDPNYQKSDFLKLIKKAAKKT